jgi:hypothetical protein
MYIRMLEQQAQAAQVPLLLPVAAAVEQCRWHTSCLGLGLRLSRAAHTLSTNVALCAVLPVLTVASSAVSLHRCCGPALTKQESMWERAISFRR